MLDNPPKTSLGPKFADAVTYALELHRAQYRKTTTVPYAAHLLGVSSIALEFGATEDEAIAALLHDAVEDCGGLPILAEIRRRFGGEVAKIVAGCSDSFEDDPDAEKAPWFERKQTYISKLAGESEGTLLVSASDKLYNALATLNDERRFGQVVFKRFKSKKWGTLWYYRALAAAFAATPGRHAAIAPRLDEIVTILAGNAMSVDELRAKFEVDTDVDDREKGQLASSASA